MFWPSPMFPPQPLPMYEVRMRTGAPEEPGPEEDPVSQAETDWLQGFREWKEGGPRVVTRDVEPDPVSHPAHYCQHPSGVECIEITKHHDFLTGNVIKYLWRAGLKGPALEDLRKAQFYLEKAIEDAEGHDEHTES